MFVALDRAVSAYFSSGDSPCRLSFFPFFPPLFSLSFNRHLLLDSVYGMVMRKRKNCLDLMFVSQATIEKEYMGGRNCFVSMDILVEISVWGEDFNVIRLVTCEIKGR